MGYDAREEWADDNDGVRANVMEVQVTVTGRADAPVLLTNLRVNIVERRPPLSGTHVTYGAIGEVVPERFVNIDLDEHPPTITGSVDERILEGTEPDPIDFPYRVSSGDIEVFHLLVTTSTCDCLWNAELSYSTDGKANTALIQDGGDKPFRLTSSAAARTYESNDGATFKRINSSNTTLKAPSPSAVRPTAPTAGDVPTCVDDPTGDVLPRNDDRTDIIRMCASRGDMIDVSVITAGLDTPLTDEYDALSASFRVDDDRVEDFAATLTQDGKVTVIDLAGSQPEVCTGTGGWDGRLSLRIPSDCFSSPTHLGITVDLSRSEGDVTFYDNVPDPAGGASLREPVPVRELE